MDLLTKEEIQKFGFIYEPDATKCKSRKLKLHVPEVIDDDYKNEVANQITYQYVHQVKASENIYEGNPNYLVDTRVIVVGHTLNIPETGSNKCIRCGKELSLGSNASYCSQNCVYLDAVDYGA